MCHLTLQVDVNKVWLSFSSVLLAFAFVFGNSLRNMYETVIFLFVMHPYDVGDALFINGDWCSVEEIALQYTQVGSHTLLHLSATDASGIA